MNAPGAGANKSQALAWIGTVVAGRYQLEAILGEGGAGILLRGRHVRTGRAVAVKLLHGPSADASVAHARLEREAVAAVDLSHPHVVEVLDFGEDDGGRPYLVMELLHGRSLQAVLEREGAMRPQRVLDLMLPILGALAVAHDRGVLHRDLKPANLFMVEHTGGQVLLKLLDFGIALVEGGAQLTQPGRVVGTLGFMSPEQIRGAPLTAASDQWSIAAVMSMCLTGRQTRIELGVEESADSRVAAPLDAAGNALQAVIARALERDPAARFEDVRAFARALMAAAHYSSLRLPDAPDSLGLPEWPKWKSAIMLESATGSFAVSGSSASGISSPRAVPAAPSRPVEGTVLLDRFLLKRSLGSGAMGVVYEAEHLLIQRPCAIKLMHPTFAADPAFRERFKKEAQRAGRILHEHVVAVTDYDVDGDTPFLVMELLRGESLRELLDRSGALPVARAAQISLQIARGLQAAHDLGVVHRDLKPQNVFVTRRADGSDQIKILDFGVAKAMQATDSAASTQAGALIGTVRYMAPEQLRSPKDVDGRADVYAAGLILYEMLAGRPAFDASDVHATIHQLLYERPPALTSLRPGLPDALLPIVERAIDPTLSQRIASAAALAEALYAFNTGAAIDLGSAPVSAFAKTETSPSAPVVQTARKSLYLVLALSAIAAIALGSWMFASKSTPQAAEVETATPPASVPVSAPPPSAAVAPPPAVPANVAPVAPQEAAQPALEKPAVTAPVQRAPAQRAPAAGHKPSRLKFDDRNPYE